MWALTIYFAAELSGHAQLTTVRLGSYSTYDGCSYAAAREDTDLSVQIASSSGQMFQRVGLAQCLPVKRK